MKKFVLGAAAVVAVLGLASCGGKEAQGDSKDLYALSYNLGDPNMSTLWGPGLEAASVELGFNKISLQDAKNDEAKAQEALDAATLKNNAAYLINVVDQKNGKTYAKKVKDTGKPLIFWNREVDKDAMDSYDKAYYVGIESAEGGRYQGKMAAEYVNKVGFDKLDRNGDGKLGVIVVRGEAGHPDADARTLFSPEYLEKNLTGGNKDAKGSVSGNEYDDKTFNKVDVLTIVDGKATDGTTWDPATATSEVERVLSTHGDKVDLVLSNNDGMALGIIKSSEFKKSGCPIWGVDALADALTEIGREGTQFMGTVQNDGKAQAKVVVQVAKNLIEGKDINEGLTVVNTKADWEANGSAVWYDAPAKAFRVHHALITAESLKK